MRVRPPHVGLSRGGVTTIVAAAARRARLGVVRAHRLRHTAASDMLRAGASLGRDRPGAATPLARLHRRLRPGRRRTAPHHCPALADGGGVVSTLAEHLDDYLRLRRGLGFQLGRHGEVLPGFVAYARRQRGRRPSPSSWRWPGLACRRDQADHRRLPARARCAASPATCTPSTPPTRSHRPACWRSRGGARRPTSTRRARSPRSCARPSGYSHRCGRPPIGRCSACWQRPGMRLGEAMALTRADVDLAEGMVTVRHAKFDRIRLVPLHPSVTAALRAYAAHAGPALPHPAGRSVLRVGHRAGPAAGRGRPGLPRDHRADRNCAPTPSTRAFMA